MPLHRALPLSLAAVVLLAVTGCDPASSVTATGVPDGAAPASDATEAAGFSRLVRHTRPTPTTTRPSTTRSPLSPSPSTTRPLTVTAAASPAPATSVGNGPATSGGVGPATSSGSAAMPGMSGLGYDPALIPAGVAGSSARRIATTGELPTDSGDGTGNFRTVCQYSHMNADDPIVDPGRPGASHLHVFWGNGGTDASSTAASIAGSGTSTCRGGIANRTAYWAPAVIDTATRRPIAPELIHVYYKSGYYGIRPDQVHPLPAGLRMVAGDKNATAAQSHAGWRCWNDFRTAGPSIPQCPSGDHVTMTVDFPQCWNGRDLDSADHHSHMTYPVNGACPTSHPVAVPVITFNILYPVGQATSTRAWRLSSDMYSASQPGGYSAHGDWFDGWDDQIRQTWTDGCVRKPVSCGSHMLGDGRVMQGDA